MKIADIASMIPGLVTTRKKASIQFEIKKAYKLLTLNAIGQYGEIHSNQLSDFESVEKLNRQYFTQEGDLLVRLNEPFTTIYIGKEKEDILIPSYFVKLKIHHKDFKPEYIAWYLNSKKVKRDFFRSQSGTLVASINQKIIKELDVPVKTMQEQESIVSLYQLHIREISLMKKLIQEKQKQFQGITERILKNRRRSH